MSVPSGVFPLKADDHHHFIMHVKPPMIIIIMPAFDPPRKSFNFKR